MDVGSVSKGCSGKELDLDQIKLIDKDSGTELERGITNLLLQDTVLQLLELLKLELLRELFFELLSRNSERRMGVLNVWSHVEQQLEVVDADSPRCRCSKLAEEGGIPGVLGLRLLATSCKLLRLPLLLLATLLVAGHCVAGVEHISNINIS